MAGCIAGQKGGNPEDEALIGKARAKVFASTIELSATERETVQAQRPRIRLYRLAGDFAQYQIEWAVADMRIVVVGQGLLNDLEGGEVKKLKSAEK